MYYVQVGSGAQVKIPRQCDLSGRDCNPNNDPRRRDWGGVVDDLCFIDNRISFLIQIIEK